MQSARPQNAETGRFLMNDLKNGLARKLSRPSIQYEKPKYDRINRWIYSWRILACPLPAFSIEQRTDCLLQELHWKGNWERRQKQTVQSNHRTQSQSDVWDRKRCMANHCGCFSKSNKYSICPLKSNWSHPVILMPIPFNCYRERRISPFLLTLHLFKTDELEAHKNTASENT